MKDIQNAVKKINQHKTRLCINDYGYMYQLSDFNNATPLETKNNLEVLKNMSGTKVIVTKEIKEVSDKGNLNYTYGNQIASVADYVILISSSKTKSIFKGLREMDYDKENIYVVNGIKEAYNLLQKIKTKQKLYVLFENIPQDDIMNKE